MAPFETSDDRTPDKTRMCPDCRMEISILATVCRFCGAKVGRPKEEARQYTIDQLGGETVEHYAPSSSVMEALESFRMDDSAEPPETGKARSGIFKRGKNATPPPAARKTGGGLPELDAHSRTLASVVDVSRPSTTFAPRKKRAAMADWPRYAAWGGGIAAVLAVLVFGGMQVWAVINRPPEQPPVPANPAVRLLERDAPALETLTAAVDHQRRFGTEEGAEVLATARERVERDVEALLNREPYTRQQLREAQRLANEAYFADPAEPLLTLKSYVAEEVRDYSLILLGTDTGASPRTATVQLPGTGGGDEELQIAEGETFLDGRFEVKAVMSNEVHLADAERGGRRLRLTRTGGLSAL